MGWGGVMIQPSADSLLNELEVGLKTNVHRSIFTNITKEI